MAVWGVLMLAGLVLLLLVVSGSILFPPSIGENDGRCGGDAPAPKTRASLIRSVWID
ncbi:MAG: hypothetical protein HYT41_00035 [Candidatus Sungbacteria bacterium]|nr:hypothetical protein [Candidatus Sungbacteria bacterium]